MGVFDLNLQVMAPDQKLINHSDCLSRYLSEISYCSEHATQHSKIVNFSHRDWRIGRILRHQGDLAGFVPPECFDGWLAVDVGHNDASIPWRFFTVDYQKITIENADADHGVAGNAEHTDGCQAKTRLCNRCTKDR